MSDAHAADAPASPVRQTPPSPILNPNDPRLKTVLQQKLISRLKKEELIEKHILISDTAPNLHSASNDLKKKLATNQLSGLIEKRPERNDLVQRGIIKPTSPLQRAQTQLQQAQTADKLTAMLRDRLDIGKEQKEGEDNKDEEGTESPSKPQDKPQEEQKERA